MAALPRQHKSPVNSVLECPINMLDFQRMFPDETSCLRYLEKIRWPKGFNCEKCGNSSEPFRIASRPRVLKCRSCQYESSVTAGTVMHRSKTSVHVWFWSAYLVSTQTPGISALELQRKLGIGRYETAFQLLHKLRAAMVRPGRDKIGAEWPLELDVAYFGGKNKGGSRGKTNQVPVIIAVEICRREIRDPETNKITKRGLAGRVRLKQMINKTAASIDQFATECITARAAIVSDDGPEFTHLNLNYKHRPIQMKGDRAKMDSCLPMVSRVTANLKTWIDGTFHGVREKHLQTYLNEYMFRFNRRFYRSTSFRTLLGLGSQSAGLTYREVYGVTSPRKKITKK